MLIYLSIIDSEEDISKFELLYNTYKNRMYHIAKDILKDVHISEDAVHMAFLRIVKNLDKIGDVDSDKTKSLVSIIVRNIAIDIYRKKKREDSNIILIDDVDLNISYEEIDPSELGEIEYAISKLQENYRQVFLLKYSHELTDIEIGEILDIRPDNVRKRLSRGRDKLKNILMEMQVYSIG